MIRHAITQETSLTFGEFVSRRIRRKVSIMRRNYCRFIFAPGSRRGVTSGERPLDNCVVILW